MTGSNVALHEYLHIPEVAWDSDPLRNEMIMLLLQARMKREVSSVSRQVRSEVSATCSGTHSGF